MNNALKFSRPGIPPIVRISHRQLPEEECSFTGDDHCYEITIEDNGIGFDPEFSEKIFNTFSRLHSKNDFEGTGLGLALCRRIVRYHKGKIWAESKKDGAIFRMVLPQKQRSENLVTN
jgi:signal transduction histidine kinase